MASDGETGYVRAMPSAPRPSAAGRPEAAAEPRSIDACAPEAWFPRWLGPPLLAAVFVALARWSWRRWPDVLVDFGSQLYIPWQLSEGRALYLDIDYKDGPLSQYLNALWFTLFGVSLDTIVWANLVLLVVLCGLVYAIFARAFGHFTATLSVLVQLAVFSFSQYTRLANYNYVCPYAQEQTHGLLLAVGMMVCLGECARRGRVLAAALAGVALGLTSLTKAELAMPALAAAILGLGLVALTRPRDAASVPAILLAFAIGAVAPIVACVLLLARRMPLALAFRGAAGNWIHLRGDILDYKFYRVGMGLDDPWGNLVWMLEAFAVIVAIVAFAAAAAWATRGLRRGRVVTALVAGAIFGGALWASSATIQWKQAGRALPIVAVLGLVGFTGFVIRHRDDRTRAVRGVAPAMWAAFALVLLGKVVLDVRISHYGFVLALPATLLLIAMLAHVVPRALEVRGANGAMGRALLVAPVLAATCFFWGWSNRVYASKNVRVGSGGDTIVTADAGWDARGVLTFQAAERLRQLMPPGATLMAMPDGLMLNYWLRRPNPTRHIYFVPWSLAFANGEAAVLEEIRQRPPDFIAIVDRSAVEYGFDAFGDEGFGDQIMQWVRANYKRVDRIGAEPLTGRGFGVLVMASDPGK
jgi:hypothetical protein